MPPGQKSEAIVLYDNSHVDFKTLLDFAVAVQKSAKPATYFESSAILFLKDISILKGVTKNQTQKSKSTVLKPHLYGSWKQTFLSLELERKKFYCMRSCSLRKIVEFWGIWAFLMDEMTSSMGNAPKSKTNQGRHPSGTSGENFSKTGQNLHLQCKLHGPKSYLIL